MQRAPTTEEVSKTYSKCDTPTLFRQIDISILPPSPHPAANTTIKRLLMPRTTTTTTTTTTTKSSSSYYSTVVLSQQKLHRQSHPNERLPHPAFLLTSKFLDALCCSTAPLVPTTLCCPYSSSSSSSSSSYPNNDDYHAGGGWRSLFPEEWVHFPTGILSHSFGDFYNDGTVLKDLTFGEFLYREQHEQQQMQPQEQVQILLEDNSSTSNYSGWKQYFLGGASSTTTATATAAITAGTIHNNSPVMILARNTSQLLTAYYTFAFQTNNTTLSTLTHPSTLLVLSILIVLLRTIKKILLPKFSSLGQTLGNAAHGSEWIIHNQDRIQKFGEYVYRLLYHSAVSLFGVWYFHDKPWWGGVVGSAAATAGGGGGLGAYDGEGGGGTKHLWIGHPNQVVYPGMAWYYLIQCAYNVDALLSLCEISFEIEYINPFTYSSAVPFLEREQVVNETQRKEQVYRMMASSGASSIHRRSILWTPFFRVVWSTRIRGDFREMMAHHLVTNALIFFSSYYRLTRVGSMVFLVHDLSDVPVDMSKLANFVKWKITTIVCFVGMVVMWMITRLYIFPFVICRAVLLESYEYLVGNGGSLDPAMYNAYYLFFYALLCSLVLLHVTWFLILLRIGWTLVSTGERHDYTEHKSGEKQKNN